MQEVRLTKQNFTSASKVPCTIGEIYAFQKSPLPSSTQPLRTLRKGRDPLDALTTPDLNRSVRFLSHGKTSRSQSSSFELMKAMDDHLTIDKGCKIFKLPPSWNHSRRTRILAMSTRRLEKNDLQPSMHAMCKAISGMALDVADFNTVTQFLFFWTYTGLNTWPKDITTLHSGPEEMDRFTMQTLQTNIDPGRVSGLYRSPHQQQQALFTPLP
jgi:hypothetical protein